MKTINMFVVLLMVSCCLAAEEAGKHSTSTGKKGEPKAPSDLPKPAGTKQTGKEKDLKSAETFGFGYYGGLGLGFRSYPAYYSYPYYGYPYSRFYGYGYSGFPYFGYRSYGHHWPYWG